MLFGTHKIHIINYFNVSLVFGVSGIDIYFE